MGIQQDVKNLRDYSEGGHLEEMRQINRSTRKAHSSLTMAVKVLTSDGGFDEFKMKEGVKGAVTPIILERF